MVGPEVITGARLPGDGADWVRPLAVADHGPVPSVLWACTWAAYSVSGRSPVNVALVAVPLLTVRESQLALLMLLQWPRQERTV